MSYAERIQEILSDGRWHCILDLIAETGLSARNRISELNQDHETKHNIKRYIGESCTLEKCDHRSDLYMYKLNNNTVSEEIKFSNPVLEDLASNRINKQTKQLNAVISVTHKIKENEDEIEDWLNKTPDERHEYVQNLLKNAGLK